MPGRGRMDLVRRKLDRESPEQRTRLLKGKNCWQKAFGVYLKKRLSSGVLFCMEPNRGDSRKMTSEGRTTVRCGRLEEGIKHFLVWQSLKRKSIWRGPSFLLSTEDREWLDHSLWYGDLVPLVKEGRITGKRRPERPRSGKAG